MWRTLEEDEERDCLICNSTLKEGEDMEYFNNDIDNCYCESCVNESDARQSEQDNASCYSF